MAKDMKRKKNSKGIFVEKRKQESPEDVLSLLLKREGHGAGLNLTKEINKLIEQGVVTPSYVIKCLKKNIIKSNPSAEKKDISFSHAPDRVLKSIKLNDFVSKRYMSTPYILKDREFSRLMAVKKIRIFLENYNYRASLCQFQNNYRFVFQEEKSRHKNSFNDTQFYLSESSNMLFAKTTYMNFDLINSASRRIAEQDSCGSEVLFNSEAYKRNMSVSMYVLLEGDPQTAVHFMRYDSSNFSHNNLFLAGDDRLEVYGEIANGAHFHFQNETDGIYCLKVLPGRDSAQKKKYKTGRCNAIDIEHLKKYLISLESKSDQEIDKLFAMNKNYSMPFLEMMHQKDIPTFDIETIIENFREMHEANVEAVLLVNQIYKLIDANVYSDYDYFGEYIKTLDVLQFITDTYRMLSNSKFDLKLKAILSKLEISIANYFVNAICRVDEETFASKNGKKFKINAPYLVSNRQMSLE